MGRSWRGRLARLLVGGIQSAAALKLGRLLGLGWRHGCALGSEVEVFADWASAESGIIVLIASLLQSITQAIVPLVRIVEVQTVHDREL